MGITKCNFRVDTRFNSRKKALFGILIFGLIQMWILFRNYANSVNSTLSSIDSETGDKSDFKEEFHVCMKMDRNITQRKFQLSKR